MTSSSGDCSNPNCSQLTPRCFMTRECISKIFPKSERRQRQRRRHEELKTDRYERIYDKSFQAPTPFVDFWAQRAGVATSVVVMLSYLIRSSSLLRRCRVTSSYLVLLVSCSHLSNFRIANIHLGSPPANVFHVLVFFRSSDSASPKTWHFFVPGGFWWCFSNVPGGILSCVSGIADFSSSLGPSWTP